MYSKKILSIKSMKKKLQLHITQFVRPYLHKNDAKKEIFLISKYTYINSKNYIVTSCKITNAAKIQARYAHNKEFNTIFYFLSKLHEKIILSMTTLILIYSCPELLGLLSR